MEIPDRGTAGLPDSVVNVFEVYTALRDDIASRSHDRSGLHPRRASSHLVDDLLASAAGGRTVEPSSDRP